MFNFSCLEMALLLISASLSRALFCFQISISRSPARRNIFFISGLNSSPPFFLICRRTISPVRFTSPTSKPLTPSTVTSSPFSKYCNEVFLKKSFRLPLLKLISTTLHALSGSANGRLASQSCTFKRLHPPVLHPPLLLQPLGLPVPQLPQPI